MTNPYSNRNIITNIKDFWGRSQYVSRIYDRINTNPPQCVNIVGESKTGKSSMLIFLYDPENRRKYLKQSDNYIFAFKQCHEWSDAEPKAFLKNLIEEIYRSSEGMITTPIEATYEGLRNTAKIITAKKKKLIVLLDDFDVITQNETYPAEFFSFLRAIANNFNMAYVITSRKSLAESCVQDDVKDSPFFNIFTSITLGPFEKDEAFELIKQPASREGVNLQDEAVFIIYLAGCFPFLLQIACSLVFEKKLEKGELKEPDLRDIRNRFVEESKGFFESIWQQLREDEIHVCEKLARADHTNGFDRETINDLLDKGYILQDEKEISLFCSGFKYFVREKYEVSDETTSLSMLLDTRYKRNGSLLTRWLSGWISKGSS